MLPLHHNDLGLQPERTSLSWTRTVLSLAICALILVRWAHAFPGVLLTISGVLLTLAVIVSLGQRRRYSSFDEGLIKEQVEPNAPAVLLVTITLTVLSFTEIMLVVLEG